MGHKFFEHDVPALVDALKRIADSIEERVAVEAIEDHAQASPLTALSEREELLAKGRDTVIFNGPVDREDVEVDVETCKIERDTDDEHAWVQVWIKVPR
jgi:uncharacterized protein CbrC (UPF0167 family)